ncbi:MAG TPA: cytochrome c5 family protein [Comamonadaceae bacterium]|nr:cytochrome c5 family protein [Comamonadaceae bacterium]
MHKPTSVLAVAALAFFLTACGDKKPTETAAPAAAPAPAAAEAPAAPAAPVADSGAGKSAYGKTCAMCHAAGVAGAPKPGDKEDWAPRIAQGNDTLYKHAIEGFTGAKGMMPARGGNANMSDEDVKAAVDYMVGLSS